MRNTVVRLGLVASLVGLLWLTTGCGGNSGNNYTQPPPPAPTIAVLPTSAGVLVGQTQTFSLTVTGNPTVTCSVNGPGSCSVSGTTSVSYTGAAPASGGDWKATLALTATNAGGSAAASVSINLGQITGVTVSPATVALAMNMTQVFTATATGNGMFSSAVTWPALGTGMGSIVASDETHATYTPPQTGAQVQGFPAVTITATGADGTTVGSATVNLGFASVAYFAPSGQNDQTTGAGALSADHTKAVVADVRAITGSSETAAGLLLCDLTAGTCSDAWNDSPVPSQIYSMAAGAPGAIYATGYEGDGTLRQAVLFKITVSGDALQVTKLVPDFQVAAGTRTQGQIVKVDQNNNINVATNEDCTPAQLSANDCVDVGGWEFTFDPTGKQESDFPMNSAIPIYVTGMDVEPQFTLVASDGLSASGIAYTTLLVLYVDGQFQNPYQSGGCPYYTARVFMNGAGDQALRGGQCDVSSTNRQFSLSSTAISNGLIDPYLPWFFAVWNGDNNGAMSINLAQNAIPNPQGGGTVMGSLSAIGSTDPNGPTDAGAIAWSGNPTPGSPTPFYWKQRFDPAHAPGGAMYSWNGAAYYADAQEVSHIVFFGIGSDGTSCGSTACTKVTVADWIPPQQSQ